MTVTTTFASLSKSGFTSNGASGSIPTGPSWINATIPLAPTVSGSYFNGSRIKDGNIYVFGMAGPSAGSISPTNYGIPYIVEFPASTGIVNAWRTYDPVTTSAETAYKPISSLEIDSLGNRYIFYSTTNLLGFVPVIEKIDNTGAFVDCKYFTGNNRGTGIDNSDFIYLLGDGGTQPGKFQLTKIDSGLFNVWTYQLTSNLNTTAFTVDGDGNSYVACIDPATTTLSTIIFKIDTNANIVWQKTYTNTYKIQSLQCDHSGNLIAMCDYTGSNYCTVMKVSSSDGTKIYERRLYSGTTAALSDFDNEFIVNEDDTIIIIGRIYASPTSYITITRLSSTGLTISQKKLTYTLAGENFFFYWSLAAGDSFVLLGQNQDNSYYTWFGVSLPINGTVPGTGSYTFNYSLTPPGGTLKTYTDTLTYTTNTGITNTAPNAIVATNTSYTITDITVASNSYTPQTVNTVTPFSYQLSI